MSTRPTRVGIASADRGALSVLRGWLEALQSCEVIAAASDPEGLAELVASAPDALILALDFPSSLEQIRSLSAEMPVLAVDPDGLLPVLEVLEAGALGVVSVRAHPEELERALNLIVDGWVSVSPELLGGLLRTVITRRRSELSQEARLEVLTTREREVFELVGRGMDRADIARQLTISPQTARTHIQRIFGKLNLHSMAEAVVLASRCGLLSESTGDGK